MKKLFAIAIVTLMAGPALAQTLPNSLHDFSNGSTSATAKTSDATAGMCEFCHVPHNARLDVNAIWNRANAATGYTGWGTFSTTVAGTTLPTGALSIGASSVRCLSCHDGSLSVGALFSTVTYAMTGGSLDAGGLLNNTDFLIDPTNMAGNHPISVEYPDNSAATTYNNVDAATTDLTDWISAAAVGTAAKVRLYPDALGGGGVGIECGSCHDPHGATFASFLRDDPAASVICRDCHNK